MSRVLVVVELAQSKPAAVSLELLGLARSIAAPAPGGVAALLVGGDPATADHLIACGADRVFVFNGPGAADYDGEIWTACARRAVEAAQAELVLAGHTTKGADFAPRLAFRLGSAVATGCTAVTAEGGELRFTRPCYGGNARETVSFRTRPAVATVRRGCYDALRPDAMRRAEIVALDVTLPPSRVRVVERRRDGTAGTRLEDARVIVAGGRGLNGPEGFRVIGDLADALGGVVGASRVPCDLGWCPHSLQIGLTGKTVTPDLYVAVGISGAGHHMAGCGRAKTIVAINTDPDAAIFRDAHFGVVGDFQKIVPLLAAAARKLKSGHG